MKKLFLLLIAIALIPSVSFAQSTNVCWVELRRNENTVTNLWAVAWYNQAVGCQTVPSICRLQLAPTQLGQKPGERYCCWVDPITSQWYLQAIGCPWLTMR